MKKIPLIPVITGSIALIAIIVTVIILAGGSSEKGLYVTETTGGVSITASDGTAVSAASGAVLNQGDILVTGEGAYCKITYKGSKNSENNFLIFNENSQAVISDKFTGKSTGEILLNTGSVLCNLAEDAKGGINIRTADTLVSMSNSVNKIAYTTDGFDAYTDIYDFMGKNTIQLYDAQGNTVNEPELMIEKRAGRVKTNDLGPEFSYLNVEFSLDALTASDLKNLLTIASFAENFPYTAEELKAAYDNSPNDDTLPAEENTETEVTTVTEAIGDNSENIQTAEPIETEPQTTLDIKPPAITTAAPIETTTAAPTETTTAAPTEATTTAADNGQTFTVLIIIDDEETIQEVPYGGSADKPDDPVVEGKKFTGWSGSFDNVTEDRTITALFETATAETTIENEVYHTVTLVIADKKTTLSVKDGEAAPIPSTIAIDGYKFIGWDTDYTNVKSDITVTAILQPTSSVTVTFVISGILYPQTIEKGGTAIPPFTPTTDINGQSFTGWDKSLSNITADTTITAIFGAETYNVTFVVDGKSYVVTVKSGENAIPPVTPTVNSKNQTFIGWDGNYLCVKSNLVINAVFV